MLRIPAAPKRESGREIMAEFRRATGLPTATNMIATDWRQLDHALKLQAVDIPLADPHFWTMQGSSRSRRSAGNMDSPGDRIRRTIRHFARDVHPRRGGRTRQRTTAIDTHWIWQDGQPSAGALGESRRACSRYRGRIPDWGLSSIWHTWGGPSPLSSARARGARRCRGHAIPDPGLDLRPQEALLAALSLAPPRRRLSPPPASSHADGGDGPRPTWARPGPDLGPTWARPGPDLPNWAGPGRTWAGPGPDREPALCGVSPCAGADCDNNSHRRVKRATIPNPCQATPAAGCSGLMLGTSRRTQPWHARI